MVVKTSVRSCGVQTPMRHTTCIKVQPTRMLDHLALTRSHASPAVYKPPLIHCKSELLMVVHGDCWSWNMMLPWSCHLVANAFPDWVLECSLETKQVVNAQEYSSGREDVRCSRLVLNAGCTQLSLTTVGKFVICQQLHKYNNLSNWTVSYPMFWNMVCIYFMYKSQGTA